MFKVLVIALLALSCRGEYELKNPYSYKKSEKEYFNSYLSDEKSKTEVTLVNTGYPIEINLLSNETFKYKLDVLGEGEGSWSYEDGYLKLYAERELFVMKMLLNQADGIEHPILEFRDRFGPNFLEMEAIR